MEYTIVSNSNIPTFFPVRESYRGDNDPPLQMIGGCPGGFGSANTRHASYPVRSHLVRRQALPRVDRKSRIGAAQIKLYRPGAHRVYKRSGLSDCFSSLELRELASLSLSHARAQSRSWGTGVVMARILALASVNSPPTTTSRFDPSPSTFRNYYANWFCIGSAWKGENLRLAPRFLHFLALSFLSLRSLLIAGAWPP